MDFWLGTHMPNWLTQTDVPLMVSHRRLAGRKTLPRAQGRWVLDSGGFTELSLYGGWKESPQSYASAVQRYDDEIGGMVWAAPQDWMCEPWIVAKTGLTVEEHQRRTVDNFVSLCSLSSIDFIPVLQGWSRDDYLRHLHAYDTRGIDLTEYPVVGLGSVCRRANEADIVDIVRELTAMGLRLHGFGAKRQALQMAGYLFTSADSMAWSYRGRRAGQQPGCTHKSCTNCLRFALRWRAGTLRKLENQQLHLGWRETVT